MTKFNPNLRLSIPGENVHLEVYESEPGTLCFEMFPNDPEGFYGGIVYAPTEQFLNVLNELVKSTEPVKPEYEIEV